MNLKKAVSKLFVKNTEIRHAGANSLTASAKLPDSGPASNNSLGASDASGEVIPYLDRIFQDLTQSGKNPLWLLLLCSL